MFVCISKDDFFVFDGGVVNKCWWFDIICSFLVSLVVGWEILVVNFVIFGDSKVVVGVSGDLDNIFDFGDFGRDDEDFWFLVVVINSIVFGEWIGWLIDLVVINLVLGEEFVIGGVC